MLHGLALLSTLFFTHEMSVILSFFSTMEAILIKLISADVTSSRSCDQRKITKRLKDN